MGFMHSRLWRLVFCIGFNEIHKYLVLYAWFYALSTILIVCCMGFIALLVFACVLHGFYRFVDIWLCVAWVLSVW